MCFPVYLKNSIASLIISVSFAQCMIAANPKTMPTSDEPFTITRALPFSSASPELTLDLYLPTDREVPIPCVIVVQGGGFRAQDGQRFRPFAEHLARQGFAAALISYRGLPKHTFADTMADATTAVRFVRKISRDHGIDPQRIGAFGRSAGATIVALLATTAEDENFPKGTEHAEYSSKVDAAVGIAGVYDFVSRFTDVDQMALQTQLEKKLKSNGAWITAPFAAGSDHWQRASAINHVTAGAPPMLLMHCTDDGIVPWQQTQQLEKALKAHGVHVETVITEKGGHGGPETKEPDMVTFFRKIL